MREPKVTSPVASVDERISILSDSKHIHTAFDDDLNKAHSLIMTMGGKVEKAIRLSSRALQKRDDELAESVIANDFRIDQLEEDINSAVIEILALRQPRATDLRMVVAIMKISSSLERVGDYAKNIAKRTTVVAHSPPIRPSTGFIKQISKAVRGMITDSLDSFINLDVEKANLVIQLDEEIDQMYNSLFRELLTHMMEDPRAITAAMHILFIAKNLERIGDHATSIAEQVIYIATGSFPEDERRKIDNTPYHGHGMENSDLDIGEKES